MRLNLGCGDDRRDDHVNVDLREDVADVVCDVRKLEHWADESVEAILALDILEHLPPGDTAPTLEEWRRVLVPGGALTVRVPNMFQLCRFVAEGWSPEGAILNIYGGHRFGPGGEWDHHCTGWTPDMLEALLRQRGFVVRSNDLGLNMTVEARRA